MRYLRHKLLLAVALSVGAASGAFAQFSSNGLVVSRVGDGSATLGSTATPVFLDQFNRTGTGQTANFTVTLPTATIGTQRAYANSGSATSEGALTLSADGRYLLIAGYNAAPGTANVATAAGIERVIARVSANGTVDTSTAFTDGYVGNNIRSVASADGSTFIIGGTSNPATTGGVRSTTFGTNTSTVVSSSQNNIRNVNIFGGAIYASSSSGANVGINTVSGGTTTLIPGTGTSGTGTPSPYDFFVSAGSGGLLSAGSFIYVADDRTTANGGGLQRFDYSSASSSFTLSYTLNTGLTAGLRGLTVDLNSAGGPTVYAVTADATSATNGNKLVAVQDTGAAAAFTVLATAAGNTAFRGVDFTPIGAAAVPEPGTLALLGAGLSGLGGTLAVRRRKSRA